MGSMIEIKTNERRNRICLQHIKESLATLKLVKKPLACHSDFPKFSLC